MSYSYVSDDPSRLSVDDVLGLIDWKELENVLSSPDDTSRPPIHVDLPMDVQPVLMAPNAKPAPPRRTRKSSRSSAAKTQTQTQTPTAAQQPTAAPPAGPPVKKKRIRREIVELKFLRGKVKELEKELRKLQLGFSTSPRADGEPVPLDGLMPSVWTSMAGRQLKDRMRAERENQELRNMLQDQLKIAQGLEDTLKQLPPSQGLGNQPAPILPPNLFGPSSSETLAESLTHLERTYLSVDEALATEGVDHLEMDKHEIKAILHPAYGTCIRFTTRIAMPFNYEITSRAMWRFITEEGLISLASSFNKIYTTKDIQAHCFAIRLPESEPAKDYWLNQVVRKHLETDRMVVVGRSTVHPYVKDSSHPTGVSFIDDARLTVNDCSSNGVPQTCVKVCVYLVPDFGSSSSNETVGINELLDFFIKSAGPVILRCREMIMTMVHQEAEAIKQTAAYSQRLRDTAAKNGKVLPFWKKIASRQYQIRLDSERENRRLRSLVTMHIGRAKRLKLAWTKRLAAERDDKENEMASRNSDELVVPDTPAVMEQLTSDADAVYAGLDAFLGDLQAESELARQMIVLLHRNANAKHLAALGALNERQQMLHSDDEAVFKDQAVAYKSDTVVSQAFGIHFITDVSDADFRCKYTVHRFNDGGRIVLVWVALLEPVELNELQYHGVRCRQIGWVEFSDLQLETTTATLARSYSRHSVEADDDAENKELQTRSLFNLAQPLHDKVGTLYLAHLEKALVEEDWKTHGFADPVTSSY
ncbi:hypothetical protein JG687_00008824 [Phytophthora cactorum]|uniref:Uncharacterized protein n=1 Tax=Phytophthora cactorum TaxID=29920 RepID=A0A8T1UBN5_9STRA|nr:hypothetical protein JG687_00008824 [Phytophthora cactorum]